MKWSSRRMEENDYALGLKRSSRNDWSQEVEDLVRDLAPYPITYDVSSTQPPGFTEFSYTEFLGGVMIKTQSIEINTRIMDLASKVPDNEQYDIQARMDSLMVDKYDSQNSFSNSEDKYYPEKVAFFVGHNLFDLISREVIGRAAFENEEFWIKMHPLTNDEYTGKIAKYVGWNRIIPGEFSAFELMRNCKTAYVSSASELCVASVLANKEIVNMSNFLVEATGSYYAINSRIFLHNNKKDQLQAVKNIIDCKWSGVIFPWMTDIEERIQAFYDKSIELKEIYKPLATRIEQLPGAN